MQSLFSRKLCSDPVKHVMDSLSWEVIVPPYQLWHGINATLLFFLIVQTALQWADSHVESSINQSIHIYIILDLYKSSWLTFKVAAMNESKGIYLRDRQPDNVWVVCGITLQACILDSYDDYKHRTTTRQVAQHKPTQCFVSQIRVWWCLQAITDSNVIKLYGPRPVISQQCFINFQFITAAFTN